MTISRQQRALGFQRATRYGCCGMYDQRFLVDVADYQWRDGKLTHLRSWSVVKCHVTHGPCHAAEMKSLVDLFGLLNQPQTEGSP